MSQIGADKPMSDVTTLSDSKLRRSTRERKPNVTVDELQCAAGETQES